MKRMGQTIFQFRMNFEQKVFNLGWIFFSNTLWHWQNAAMYRVHTKLLYLLQMQTYSIIRLSACFSSMSVGSVSDPPINDEQGLTFTLACALVDNDKETLYNVARWFTKEYQFVTDGYRLYAALNRLGDKESAWYNRSPSQKYVLRQLKAMDFSLVDENRYKTLFNEKASYFTKDEAGNSIRAADLDIGLIMLYGQILYSGRSYAYSISLELPYQ